MSNDSGAKPASVGLDSSISNARAEIGAVGLRMHRSLSLFQALLLFFGGGLISWGGVQLDLEKKELGAALVICGIILTGIHILVAFWTSDNPLQSSIEKLKLGEHAHAQMMNLDLLNEDRDRLRSENMQKAQQIASLSAQLHELRINAEIMVEHRNAMITALVTIADMASTVMSNPDRASPYSSDLRSDLTKVFATLRGSLVAAFNLDPDEFWTCSIYSRERQGDNFVMRRLVPLSKDGAEEQDDRLWTLGNGFVGEAWESGDRLVVPDRDEGSFANRFHGSGANWQAGDVDLYKSVAIFPIRIGPRSTLKSEKRKNIVGCIIATSSKSGRFLDDQQDPRALNAEMMRLLASIVRLLIVSWRPETSSHFIKE